eukprot:XP_012826975.1 PREDICTED: dehydrogenase/reductase SDR family member 7C isoform X1 [Xenopus tropicalis]
MGFLTFLIVPLLILGISGIVYIYREVVRLMSRSALKNKVVVITDAISGLGKECSRVFHSAGARLVLCGKTWEKLEALHDALISVADPSVTFTPKLVLLDISDINNMEAMGKEIQDCYGCVDVLINNASMKMKGPLQSVSLELDKKIMDANYFGPITLVKAILPHMISRRTGQIVLVNTIQGKIGVPFRAAYAASKHAIQGFFDCLRAEVEEFDVSVSTVSPTFIRSYHVQPQPGNWEASIWKWIFYRVAMESPACVASRGQGTPAHGAPTCNVQEKANAIWKSCHACERLEVQRVGLKNVNKDCLKSVLISDQAWSTTVDHMKDFLLWIKVVLSRILFSSTAKLKGLLKCLPPLYLSFEEENVSDTGNILDELNENQAMVSGFDLKLIDHLVKAVRKALEFSPQTLSKEKAHKIFGKKFQKAQMFPFHPVVKDLIITEWKRPEKSVFISPKFTRMYPLDTTNILAWEVPKVDEAILKIVVKTVNLVEDSISFKDTMERMIDSALKRSYQAGLASFRPAIAMTSVSRAMKIWLKRLEYAVVSGVKRCRLLEAMDELKLATEFLSEASLDLVRLIAQHIVLSVVARRRLWLRACSAKGALIEDICKLPFTGGLLFGAKLDEIIRKTSRGKRFCLTGKSKKWFRYLQNITRDNKYGRYTHFYHPGRLSNRPSSWRGGQSTFTRRPGVKDGLPRFSCFKSLKRDQASM